MGDYALAYVLIGVIGLIMLFCFLKMHEYLKQINEKMDKVLSEIKNSNNALSNKTEKMVDELINANRTLNDLRNK